MVDIDFQAIRKGLSELPRADNHAPDQTVNPEEVYAVQGHRAALDPDRALVVANRGMGKSFWTHALSQDPIRQSVSQQFRQPDLKSAAVSIGFNASERADSVAPSPDTIRRVYGDRPGRSPESIWNAVIARAAGSNLPVPIPQGFSPLVQWVDEDPERYASAMTEADNRLATAGRRLLLVFDALDRLGEDWETTRALTRALLRRALAARSYRTIRIKLFMRLDQFEDSSLFDFPDASKIRNTRVDLEWRTEDLYGLLFSRLERLSSARESFRQLQDSLRFRQSAFPQVSQAQDSQKLTVDALAGEFMGASKKRGRVFTWLPTHLADARGQTSPRTFLTVWREAAHHGTAPLAHAVDHLGIMEGVRKASEDRFTELAEDYKWIRRALEPLKGQMVPMERETLEAIWRERQVAERVVNESRQKGWLAPVQLGVAEMSPERALVTALETIGVLEIRRNGKINVPDIFRVEAGIKRKGGVRPPRRGSPPDSQS